MVLALSVLAAGCATGPTESGAPPAADESVREPVGVSTGLAATASSCTVPRRLVGVEVERLPVTDRVVALTFDAGANADGVRPVLRVLRNRHVPATFFLTGRFVQRFPVLARRIADEHLVGNHTLTHPDLTTLSDRAVAGEVRRAERVILRRTGEDPRRFFRFPYGARDARTIGLVNDLCYVPFRWTVDTLGWKGTSGGMSTDEVVRRVVDAAEPGAVVLMHVGSNPDDGTTLDADALPRVVRQLRLRDYELVRLARVLGPRP